MSQMPVPFAPEQPYIYDIPQILGGNNTSDKCSYSLASMIEYVVHAETAPGRISRIYHCEFIPELTETDRNEFRERIAYMYDYHSKVYQDTDFSGDMLSVYIPHYKSLLGKAQINVATERLKQHPSISPAFNGSGCFIL